MPSRSEFVKSNYLICMGLSWSFRGQGFSIRPGIILSKASVTTLNIYVGKSVW